MFEGTYGINIIRPREDEDPDRSPTSEELLMAYGCETTRYFYEEYTERKTYPQVRMDKNKPLISDLIGMCFS